MSKCRSRNMLRRDTSKEDHGASSHKLTEAALYCAGWCLNTSTLGTCNRRLFEDHTHSAHETEFDLLDQDGIVQFEGGR